MSQEHTLRHINLSSDTEFLSYVRLLGAREIDDIVLHAIHNRCAKLGYTFELGCCGVNTLEKRAQNV